MFALWLRWVIANAASELFGLGLTFVVAAAGFTWLESQGGILSILAGFVFAVVSGIFEATLVGLGQWWAMHPWFPTIRRGDWWRATTIGALIAYFMGYLPSTIMSLGAESASSAPVTEPAQGIVLLLAAAMGLVGGAVLSFAQWLVLRKHVQRTGIWIPANMLAWMVGMPLIFWGIDATQRLSSTFHMMVGMAGVLLAVGVIVGAIHGFALTRLAKHTQAEGG
jgi:hypothetical protein